MSYFRKRSVIFNFDPFRQIIACRHVGANSITFSNIEDRLSLRHGRLLETLSSLLPHLLSGYPHLLLDEIVTSTTPTSLGFSLIRSNDPQCIKQRSIPHTILSTFVLCQTVSQCINCCTMHASSLIALSRLPA